MKTSHPQYYVAFDTASLLLIKYEDDTTDKVNIAYDGNPLKDHSTINTGGRIHHVYMTFTHYPLTPEVKENIFIQQKPIKKIRVVFANSVYLDYELDSKYAKKFSQALIDGFNDVTDKVLHGVDVEAGF